MQDAMFERFMAGDHEYIAWTGIQFEGMTVHVSSDAIKVLVPRDTLRQVLRDEGFEAPESLGDARIRFPVCYEQHVAACRKYDWVPPTAALSDAIWRAAGTKIDPKGLVQRQQDARFMATMGFILKHNQGVDAALAAKGALSGTLVAGGVGKDWILHKRLEERGAVNYGWHRSSGSPVQPVAATHDRKHFDYSQVLRAVRREARAADGSSVDLLEWMRKSHRDGPFPVAERFLQQLDGRSPLPIA